MREKVSAPIDQHRRRLAGLEEIVGDGEGIDEARAHGLQIEGGAPVMPSLACTCVAVAGKVSSGVEVASTIEIDVARAEAGLGERRARRQVARSDVSSPSAAMWRWPMPVR